MLGRAATCAEEPITSQDVMTHCVHTSGEAVVQMLMHTCLQLMMSLMSFLTLAHLEKANLAQESPLHKKVNQKVGNKQNGNPEP